MRESKEIDDEFEKAQRQWKKLLEKADLAKKAYHAACRNEKSTYIQLMNSQGDASTVNDHADKTRDKHNKCLEAVCLTVEPFDCFFFYLGQENSQVI
jgi:hypothetical protein